MSRQYRSSRRRDESLSYPEIERLTDAEWRGRRAAAVLFLSSHLGRGWKIAWTQSTTNYGQQLSGSKTIKFSERLLRRLSKAHFLDIVAHEVAHAMTDKEPEEMHGPLWRKAMRDMGYP